MEANAARQATPAEWGQGAPGSGRSSYKCSDYQFGLLNHGVFFKCLVHAHHVAS